MEDILAYLGVMLAAIAVGYVYFGIVISMLAGKTGTPNGWMAWVPVANIVLLCRIAGKSPWLILAMLIPLVNIFIFAMVWMGVARARGKSPALGIVMIVPLVNLIIPWILIAGPASGAVPPAIPNAPPFVPPAAAPQYTSCPACGRAECVGEEFCGYTGKRIRPEVPTPAPAPAAAAAPQIGMTAKIIGGVIVVAGLVYTGYGMISSIARGLGGASKSGATASANGRTALPGRAAGTLTEFPVDTAATPAKPSNVQVRNLRTPPSKDQSAQLARTMPRGVTQPQLARVADSMTSAEYHVAPSDPPVNVHVLSAEPGVGPQAQGIAQTIAASSAGQMTGIRVQSPDGSQYTGFRVRDPQTETFVLDKTNAPVIIVIFAPDPRVNDLAARLAGNVGNGAGLNDDPAIAATLSTLPDDIPPGLQLGEVQTYTSENLSSSLSSLNDSVSGNFGPDARQWIDQVGRFAPSMLTTAKYHDRATRGEFNVVVGNYGGSIKSWSAWQLLRTAVSTAGMSSYSIPNADAMSATDSGTQYILFRRGGCLGFVSGPDSRTMKLVEGINRAGL